METMRQNQAAQFRVALLLKQYRFGAVAAAKYLGKPRGLVQSWMQVGNKHYLSKEKINLKNFEKILKELRRKITNEHMDYFLVKRLLTLDLPVAFISRILELPTSTVRSWKNGKIPVEVKKFFYDRKLVDYKFKKLLKTLKQEITTRNLEYYLSLYLANISKISNSRRAIGGRIISQILTNHFGYIELIPEKTVSCWIDGKRKPWEAFPVLMDQQIIQHEYKKIVDELTYRYLDYHVSKALAEKYNWEYSRISKVLGMDKELIRGWVKKDRGNPVAKTFVNEVIVEVELKKYIGNDDFVEDESNSTDAKQISLTNIKATSPGQINLKTSKDSINDSGEKKDELEFDEELEHELIYHLETIPTGVTSAKVLKSILIHHRNASVEKIKKVLHLSKYIVKNKNTGKWMLKRFLKDKTNYDNLSIDEELAKIDYKKGQDDEIIC